MLMYGIVSLKLIYGLPVLIKKVAETTFLFCLLHTWMQNECVTSILPLSLSAMVRLNGVFGLHKILHASVYLI